MYALVHVHACYVCSTCPYALHFPQHARTCCACSVYRASCSAASLSCRSAGPAASCVLAASRSAALCSASAALAAAAVHARQYRTVTDWRQMWAEVAVTMTVCVKGCQPADHCSTPCSSLTCKVCRTEPNQLQVTSQHPHDAAMTLSAPAEHMLKRHIWEFGCHIPYNRWRMQQLYSLFCSLQLSST